MKTKLLAALIGACFAAPVMAQSSITIYGIADAGIQVNSNGEGTKTKLVSGIADGSRLGFKGMEDMGGGYKAIFTLESRVELDTGKQQAGNISDDQGYALTKGMVFPSFGSAALAGAAAKTLAGVRAALQPAVNVNSANALFDRTSMVGLITPFGAILAGRQYTPGYEVFAAADTFEAGTAGGWGGVTGGTGGLLTAGTAIRSDKALQYRIQLPSGVNAALMYGFKNSGYVGLDKNFWSANVTYKKNGIDAGIGYNRGTNQDGARGLVTATVGGSYRTGDFKFFAGYQDMKNDNSILIPVFDAAWDGSIAPSLTAGGVPAPVLAAWTSIFKTNLAQNFKLDAGSYSVGMHYYMGAGRIMGSVSHQNDRTASDSDATQYAIGYDYNLSKRTDIYTVLAYIKNKNDGQYAPGAASAPGGFTLTPGEAGRALQIGMRHKF